MKKVVGILALCLILTLAGTAFSGCGLFGGIVITTEVSSAEQLQEAGGNIRLIADIDFGGEIFDPIEVTSFDGNGHTISNAIVVASGSQEHASFFADVADGVRDVTFENISVSSEGTSYAAIVWDGMERSDAMPQGEEIEFENVHIKDCTIEFVQGTNETRTFVGGMVGWGGLDWTGTPSRITDRRELSFTGCTVENLTANIDGYEPSQDGAYNIGPDLYVGGLSACADGMENCSVLDSKITVHSHQRYSEPYVGGLVGYLEGGASVSGCRVSGNTIEASALYYRHISLVNAYECSDVYLGGLFAESAAESAVSYCSVDGNSLQANSVGGYYLAGIGSSVSATVSQCAVVENTFVGVGRLDGENKNGDPWTRNIGGISASSSAVTFSSTFTYGNDMTATLTLDGTSSTDPTGSAVGFSKTTADAVFLNCATGANTMDAGSTDEFATAALKNATNCYVTSETYGNAQGFELISETDWLSEDSISELLNLSGSRWQYAPGDIPRLSFS